MAETGISFLIDKLSALVSEQASIFGSIEEQVEQLCNELEWIRQFLEYADAERRYNKMFKLWVSQIREAAYDAEDAIDEFVFKVDRKRQQRLNNLKFLNFLPDCISLLDKFFVVNKLNKRISEINTRLEKILIHKGRYGMEDPKAHVLGSSYNNANTYEPWRFSNQMMVGKERTKWVPTIEESDIVGMTKDVEHIVEKLLDEKKERRVVAITGIGGLAKTAVAKKIYQLVKQEFDTPAWVVVSQEFNIKELLLGIWGQLNANSVMTLTDEHKGKSEEELGQLVRNCLMGKRYLIVLDDVWSIDVWQKLSSYFPDNSNGDRVMITTRRKDIVADYYELQHLGPDESWKLFLKKVGSEAVQTWREMEKFKNLIVEKCNGLPLAIVMLAGLLSLKDQTSTSWEMVLKNLDWHLGQGPDSYLGILALSYNDLPSYLKSCFLYCGIFPGGFEIGATQLTRLWIAEGFIQKRGKDTPENIAEDYLNELIQRNMIQVAKTRPDGRVKSCRILDLVRDLAISEAKEEKLFEVDENIDMNMIPRSVRRLASDIHQTTSLQTQNSNIRSLILNRCHGGERREVMLDKYPELLRVLHVDLVLHDFGISRKIGELIYLKHLYLREIQNGEIKLPSSIGQLVNLQTLDSGKCCVVIPQTIWKLQQVRVLNCRNGKISPRRSKRQRWLGAYLAVHQMTNLQTLSLMGGNWMENGNLGKLAQLKELKIIGYSTSSLSHAITQLTGLQKLKFFSTQGMMLWLTSDAEAGYFSCHTSLQNLFLGGTIPKLPSTETEFYPPNLVQLKLEATELKEDPMLILGSLPNLRILCLFEKSYVGAEMNCPRGGFLLLEFLQIQRLINLEDLLVEEGAMPNLKTLKIEGCPNMRKFPTGILWQKKLHKLNPLLYMPVKIDKGGSGDKRRILE